MAVKQRRFTVFSLSFLDIMSCGFGATVLVFILIHHSTLDHADEVNAELLLEVALLEQEIDEAQLLVTQSLSDIEQSDRERVQLEARVRQLLEQTDKARDEMADQDQTTMAQRERVEALMADVRALEARARRLEGAAAERRLARQDALSFVGAGDRQYLTGLKLGGRRILILLDSSASMLDSTLVNIIRRRNMPLERKLEGPKWQRSLESVEWILSNIPETSEFQVYLFDEAARPLIEGTEGEWFDAGDSGQVGDVAAALRKVDPGRGTSLHYAFRVIAELDPIPDNVILITDGLPTIGDRPPRRKTVSARNRLRLFRRALQELPIAVPINTILLPLEGDPDAASQFWRLATISGGSFLSPSDDWP